MVCIFANWRSQGFFVGREAMWFFFPFFLFFLSFLTICRCEAEVQKVTPKIINHWGDVWIVVNFVNENVVLLQMKAFMYPAKASCN